MKATAYGSLTHTTKGQYAVSVAYDPELQMSRLVLRDLDGSTEISVNLPTQKLAGLLADAFESAASDPHSIGYDTWRKDGNLNPRLAHLGGAR